MTRWWFNAYSNWMTLSSIMMMVEMMVVVVADVQMQGGAKAREEQSLEECSYVYVGIMKADRIVMAFKERLYNNMVIVMEMDGYTTK